MIVHTIDAHWIDNHLNNNSASMLNELNNKIVSKYEKTRNRTATEKKTRLYGAPASKKKRSTKYQPYMNGNGKKDTKQMKRIENVAFFLNWCNATMDGSRTSPCTYLY